MAPSEVRVRTSVVWDYAMRAAVPAVVALTGFLIRSEVRAAAHETMIDRLERDSERQVALQGKILEELTAIRVSVAKVEERIK